MRLSRIIIGLALVACLLFIMAVVVPNEPRPPPHVRSAHQRLEAPFFRSECRNHQYIVIETDAYGVQREIDEGQFCDIDE